MARILLAEDDEALRRVLTRTVLKAGHCVIAVGNGVEALGELKTHRFDLIVTDVVMPEMDGIALAREARGIDPDLRVVFITGFAAVALNPRNTLPAHSRLLSKPFHLRDIVQAIDDILL